MNILSFTVEPLNPPSEMALAAVPLIDGVALTVMIEQFENQRRFEPSGGYGGLVIEFINFGPLQTYFACRPDWEHAEGVFILACECGELGCWPLKCHVRQRGDLIVWEQFSQPHRPERDYAEFGPFTFAVDQYARAITRLQTAITGA